MKRRFTKAGLITMLLAFVMIIVLPHESKAQDDDRFSMDVTLNSDIFFGFYPFFAGSYSLSEKSAFTFYGILWSGGAAGGSWGNWTEFGIGMDFTVAEGININPQIGLLSGSLTSGLGTPVLGEGIVPNLTIGIDKARTEGEIYFGYYSGFDHGNPNTNNYIHYWVNYGVKFSPFFSAGLHLEQLRFTGGMNQPEDPAYDFYLALGPYVQFADPNGGAFARFTSGADLRSDDMIAKSGWTQPSFFKLTVGYSF
ncbi:hypothetical protein A33Q_0725 [Indibacter alkaliphilus LW1]|uniref:Outer membrane protein beta-barrel domain-containing protein n=1 Tax=Indibacter alkaliphilus (strain CCUG 57479 / KCTC 22604 / LW1) TaxID=1189612 RepID=S2DJK7_INDAL|nr:DUF6733 family protein [Indibacter alkaliphilus]EOZ99122.1 hypothetical protein A33Q_0725 [Indibacter alkaliphilus LW1]